MKPRTKLQKAVVQSAEMLPPLSDFQRLQAIKHIAPHTAKCDSKGNYVCLDCGGQWAGTKAKSTVCPYCRAKLDVDISRKRNFRSLDYFAIVTTCNGFQVVRMFLLTTKLRKGDVALHWIDEVFQRWLTSSGDNLIISLQRNFMARYCDSWDWSSDLELRHEHIAHSIVPCKIIGRPYVIPALRRNGFDGNCHGCNPHYLFTQLLRDNRFETLWKVGQYSLFRYFCTSPSNLDRFWPSIKVLMRHNYQVDDASLWCDLWRFLRDLHRDVHNPKLICPSDLKAAHDELQQKYEANCERIARIHERQRGLREVQWYLRNPEQVKSDELRYAAAKSKFFDLVFTDNELTLKPLVSIQEFIDEGLAHHHCVFSMKYYKRPESLIFHAMVNNESVATIEFNLVSMEVVQCRGKYNSKPEYYDRIISLINKNKNKIIQKHELNYDTQTA